jgi:hypothetical protein
MYSHGNLQTKYQGNADWANAITIFIKQKPPGPITAELAHLMPLGSYDMPDFMKVG